MTTSWDEVRRWRRERRRELIARRKALAPDERAHVREAVTAVLERHVPGLADALVGVYWPIGGEIVLQGLVRRLIAKGARMALPVVVEKNAPLEFRAWRPGDALEPGIWNIPQPVARAVVQPGVLLVPLVGFDPKGYRLGHGGGYYDRTLAAMVQKPLTIGLGYELARLETIHPQAHDVPMDAIVTEAGWFDAPAAKGRAGGVSRTA